MTPLHKRICGILYPILTETARKQRVVSEGDEDDVKGKKIRAILEKHYPTWGNAFSDSMREMLFEITGYKALQDQMGRPAKLFAPFTVLFGTFDKTPNSLAICLHEKGLYLKANGETNNFTLDTKKIASDDQIKQFLEDLTPAQLRFIMSNPLFQPMMNTLYEEPEPAHAAEPTLTKEQAVVVAVSQP